MRGARAVLGIQERVVRELTRMDVDEADLGDAVQVRGRLGRTSRPSSWTRSSLSADVEQHAGMGQPRLGGARERLVAVQAALAP